MRQTQIAMFLGGFLLNSLSSLAHAQDYSTSVVGTEFDYITTEDPSAFDAIAYQRFGKCEMPDKRDDSKLWGNAYIFNASFSDQTSVVIFVDEAFVSEQKAETEASRYVDPLGKLPTALRRGVKRLVIHKGGKDVTAFSDQGLIVMYSENASQRIKTHDLEETIFHESVHASWDAQHANSPAWKRAQAADGAFATVYAKRNPQLEDLAESALFAYTILHHPERLPKSDREKIRRSIPHRIAYVGELIPPNQPLHFDIR